MDDTVTSLDAYRAQKENAGFVKENWCSTKEGRVWCKLGPEAPVLSMTPAAARWWAAAFIRVADEAERES